MEKQFDLIFWGNEEITRATIMDGDILVATQDGMNNVEYKGEKVGSRIFHFKLSDIGIEDMNEIAFKECGNDTAGKKNFINGYNKAKEKYKYTEDDIEKAVEIVMNRMNDKDIIKGSFDVTWFINNNIKKKLNKLPTKVWLEMEEVAIPKSPKVGLGLTPDFDEELRIKTELQIKVDENNYVKVLRYG